MKIVVVGVYTKSLVAFRGQMLASMAELGHDVLAMGPENSSRVRAELEALGASFASFPLRRAAMSPVADMRATTALARAFRAFGADMVFVYGAKPVVYGLLAARAVGVRRRAAMVTGVGSGFGDTTGLRGRAVRLALRTLYRVALRQAHVVFFQNPDDERLFRSLGFIRRSQRTVRVNGSGVDLEWFAPAPLPDGPLTFLMTSRLLAEKGVREYVEAARILRHAYPDVRFRLLGPLDPNPSSIRREELDGWIAEGCIEYLGKVRDVRPHLAGAHVFVLPSSYGEGTPRSVLEAMAMGRPVVTTDAPGCRETVEPGRNGVLVPKRDVPALARALERFITEPESLAAMGRESRRMAEERFDVHAVNRVILAALKLGGPMPGTSAP